MATVDPPRGRPSADERRALLLTTVEEQGFCTIAELSALFGVSEMTIRRDVRVLVDEGRMRSVHGGVTLLASNAMDGTEFNARLARRREAKKAIAEKAIELLPTRGAVAFDAGTTTLEIANALPSNLRLHIVTASLPIIYSMLGRDNFDVIGLGGTLHHNSQSFAGPTTLAAIAELRVRTLFLAASGLSAGGVWCGNYFDAGTKRALVNVADEVVLVADSSKFALSAMVRACSLDSVDVIVTDDGLTEDARQALVEHDVKIVTVPTDVGDDIV